MMCVWFGVWMDTVDLMSSSKQRKNDALSRNRSPSFFVVVWGCGEGTVLHNGGEISRFGVMQKIRTVTIHTTPTTSSSIITVSQKFGGKNE